MTNTCRICAEPIKDGSRKCIHCDSRQDWRRHLDFSSGILSLLIALFAVVGLAGERLSGLWSSDYSQLELTVLKVNAEGIHLLAVNSGNQTAAIVAAELEVQDSRAGATQYVMTPQDNDFLVQGGKVRQVHLVPERKDMQLAHRKWIKELFAKNTQKTDRGFKANCELSVWNLQYRELAKALSAHSNFTRAYSKQVGSKASSDTNAPVAHPKEETAVFEVNCHDVFPWLWAQQDLRLEPAEPNTALESTQ